MRDIKQSHVHGDAAENGAEVTLDESVTTVGKGTWETVGVAGGNGGDV